MLRAIARRLAGERQRALAFGLPGGDQRREHRARSSRGPIAWPASIFVLPENLQGWYDGRTTITLPSGRRITPPANTYLKYNPDAFAGRVVDRARTARIVADQFWYGNAELAYDEHPHRLAVQHRPEPPPHVPAQRRRWRIDVGLDAMNVLNHTQFNGAYTGRGSATPT